MLLGLSAMASSALEWTIEHMAPWATRASPKLFTKWRLQKARKQRALEVLRVALATPPDTTIFVELICTPATSHGFHVLDDESAQVRFCLRFTSIAPIAVRPVSVMGKYTDMGGNFAVTEDLPSLHSVSPFLNVGYYHEEELDRVIHWKGKTPPPPGTALHLYVAGTLKVLACWPTEYGEVPFVKSIYMIVR